MAIRPARLVGMWVGLALATATAARGDTFIYLSSDPGDYIGLGGHYLLGSTNGTFTATGNYDNGVSISFDGNTPGDFWYADFAAPSNATLTPGTYEGATRWPFQAASEPGLSIAGDGRGCNMLSGRFVVREATYGPSGEVESFAADFEQHCEGADAALRGAIRFRSGDVACAAGDGASCNDLDPCTQDDACHGGVCSGTDTITATCGVADGCHEAPLCDRLTATCTQATPRRDGTACDDADVCTATSACAAGQCVGHDPLDCNDHSPCTVDRCDPALGCVHDTFPGACWVAHPELLLVDTAAANGHSARCVLRCQSAGTSTLILDDDGTYRFVGGIVRDCPSGEEVRFPDEIGATRPGRRGRLVLIPSNLAEIRTATRACTPAARGPRSYHGSLGRPGGGSLLIATISTEFRFPGRIPVTRHATTRSTYVPGLDAGGPVLPPFPSTNLPLCSATLRPHCEVH